MPPKKRNQPTLKKKKNSSQLKKSFRKFGGFLRELFTSSCNVTSKAPTCDSSTSPDSCTQYNTVTKIQQQQQSNTQYDIGSQTVSPGKESVDSACGGTDPTTCSNNNYNAQQDSYNSSKSSTTGQRPKNGGRRSSKKSLKKKK